MLLYFFLFMNIKQNMYGRPCTSSLYLPPLKKFIYILIYFGHKTLFSPNLMIIIMGTLETPQTIWNNSISHRFISFLSDVIPFTKALCHNHADDAWTSNVCHGHNFHHRDLKFSDVRNTLTIFKHNLKKNDENQITSGMVPLTRTTVHYNVLWSIW